MERRVEIQSKHTPTSEQLVVPPLPMVPVELDVEPADTSSVSFSTPSLQTDRLLERLGPRRLKEIRARLASGAYNSPEVMTALAMRMLESGDLA